MTQQIAEVIKEVSALITQDKLGLAADLIRTDYPFTPTKNVVRQYTTRQMTRIFMRDGFIDRYKGNRLIYPPALRLISHYLPNEFPYHKNGKMTEGHLAYWELFPTIDHIMPVARGGSNTTENWVCCSMLTNSIKSNWTLDQLNWDILPVGDINAWDGLIYWFLERIEINKELLNIPYFKRWYGAAMEQV